MKRSILLLFALVALVGAALGAYWLWQNPAASPFARTPEQPPVQEGTTATAPLPSPAARSNGPRATLAAPTTIGKPDQPGTYVPEAAPPPPPSVERGAELATSLCGSCHAVRSGVLESPVPAAPPFWTFKKRWPLSHLEEALAEGIMVSNPNHPMPTFKLEPEDIADLIAYLDTLKGPKPDAELMP